jgi:hydroxymethylpyrimidine/phosphomethylpyrimidine kinase
MTRPVPDQPELGPCRVALTIAGSDSCGGAGVQADLKVFAMLGCYGASAITAVTAQNTSGVQAAELLSVDLIERQIASVATDLPVAATKTGMLGSTAIIRAVCEAVRRHDLFPLVVDPVMIAKSGDKLIDDDAVAALVEHLLPLATVVTPNRHEAERIVGFGIQTLGEATRAAEVICNQLGARACVVKAIRSAEAGQPVAIDVFCDGDDVRSAIHPWHESNNTHGSGCAFAAAVTAGLACGQTLPQAMHTASRYIDAALASPLRLGHGTSPVDHLAYRQERHAPPPH